MAGTKRTVLKGVQNPRPQFSSVNQNKKEGKKKNNGDDPQDGDPRADTMEQQSGIEYVQHQSFDHEKFKKPVIRARFPVLDEDMIAERGRSSPPDHGGGRRLAVKQSEKKDVGQTRFASISTTPIQTDSKLMQSKVEATSKRVSNNDTPTSRHLSTDHLNQEKKNKKKGKKKNNGQIINSDDPQDGDPRADTKDHQSKVLQFGAWDNTVEAPEYSHFIGQKSAKTSREFREPVNNARFSVLDEDRIADERGRSSPPDHGGGRRITVNQSEKKDVGQTRFASRGIAISTTPMQTDSNLMQSNVEATSERVSNNDNPTSRHLSTDHPNQEKKIGFTSMFVWKRIGRKRLTTQNKKQKEEGHVVP